MSTQEREGKPGTAADNGQSDRHFPDPAAAVRLLRTHLLAREDQLAFWPPWGKAACPMAPADLDAVLLAHVAGTEAPEASVTWYKDGEPRKELLGRWRCGSYTVRPGASTVRHLCIDCDGGGRHARPLKDPLGVALAILLACEALGLPAYLERSGGGKGWHVWIFFSVPVPAVKARALGLLLVPEDVELADGGKADAAASIGIEVFPKQEWVEDEPGAYGNQVWMTWWHGAATGGNEFYRPTDDGLQPYVPDDFEAAGEDDLDAALAELRPEKQAPGSKGPSPFAGRATGSYADDGSGRVPTGLLLRRALGRAPRNAAGFWLACQL